MTANVNPHPKLEECKMDDSKIASAKAHEFVKNGAKLLDVRSPAEFVGGAVPGAINVPVQVIATQIASLAKPEETLVIYCAAGGRSAVATQIVRSMGYSKAYNLGGIGEW